MREHRIPILTANWKLHMTATLAAEYVRGFLPLVADVADTEIVLAPPFTALDRSAAALGGSRVQLAAQNVSENAGGAFTGEISVEMLAEFDCHYAIVGHSERRAIYGESNETVAAKAAALLAHGIRPILCVGESLAERDAERTREVVEEQLAESLRGIAAEEAPRLVIAYEPVWAIGTGKTATPSLAQEVHGFIRKQLASRFGPAAEEIRIQYGGSVKPENAAALLAEPDIDGALVGGASLDPASFASIVLHAEAHAT